MSKGIDRKTKERPNRSKRSVSSRSSAAEKLTPAGSKIVAAFDEAIEAMRSGEALEKRLSVRTYKADFACPTYGPEDVRRVRGLLGMSQVFFARFLGVDPNTVRSWEQGARPPSPIASDSWGRSKRTRITGGSGSLRVSRRVTPPNPRSSDGLLSHRDYPAALSAVMKARWADGAARSRRSTRRRSCRGGAFDPSSGKKRASSRQGVPRPGSGSPGQLQTFSPLCRPEVLHSSAFMSIASPWCRVKP
jgi:DNA-binding transcriptional regulator YiaG